MDWKPCVPCTIPKHDGTSAVFPSWHPTRQNYPDGRSLLSAIVACGDCHMALVISGTPGPEGNHTIDKDGRVQPSIGCGQCGWHIWGTLEEWVPDSCPEKCGTLPCASFTAADPTVAPWYSGPPWCKTCGHLAPCHGGK